MKNVISYVNVILETGIAERESDVHIKHNNEESEISLDRRASCRERV